VEGATTDMDRLRLLLIMQLHPSLLSQGDLERVSAALSEAGIDTRAMPFLRRAAIHSISSPAAALVDILPGRSACSTGERVFTRVLNLADQVSENRKGC